jgi:G3E family GTPase
LTLNGVVTTVDAVTGIRTLAREQVSKKQVALADRLIVTKSDLAAAAPVLDRLAALNSSAPVVFAQHGILDPRVFDHDGTGSADEHSAIVEVPHTAALMRATNGVQQTGHAHDTEIQTCAILRNEPIHAVALTLFLETLAEHCGADLLRLKGIVNILESPDRPAVIHGVQHVFHPLAWLAAWPSDDRRSRMVFITRRIPQRWIELLLETIDGEVATVSRAGQTC